MQKVQVLKNIVKTIYQGLNKHGVVPNKRILFDHQIFFNKSKIAKTGNHVQINLSDNERNTLYD